MKTTQFDFTLPDGLIANQPANRRDYAQMLCVSGDSLSDKHIYDLPDMLQAGDLLVLNNSKVIPARLYGKRDAVNVEVLLHKQDFDKSSLQSQVWKCFARPAKRLKEGNHIIFSEGFFGEVVEKLETGEILLQFDMTQADFYSKLIICGEMPLPPYIARPDGSTKDDESRYQTVYAKKDGSVAAPTAGLHFTPELLKKIEDKGVEIAYVTLHVGGGTFLPVKVDDISDHLMHSEFGAVCERVADKVNKAKTEGRRVIPVGTTSMRLLESAADENGVVQPFCAETDIFIYPSYQFKVADAMLTNFHLPKSTLFMLVSAFSGLKQMHKAYSHAIEKQYRFYSYGDSCFLEKLEE